MTIRIDSNKHLHNFFVKLEIAKVDKALKNEVFNKWKNTM